jgi:2-polyprenyl-3-methyl-5-hydroxy-6-metoxy-1,4-benzoquinol methylase
MWDERYADEEYVYGTEPNVFLKTQIAKLPQGKILSLCEGEGRNAVYLAKQGYEVTGVDSSSVGLEKAEKLAAREGVTISTELADMGDFHIEPNAWDGVVSIFCHIPPAMRGELHRQVVAGLKPGGVLILEAYTPEQLAHGTGGPKIASLTMTAESLKAELEGLEIESIQELERDVVEGKFHTGRGAVVQLVARKPG